MVDATNDKQKKQKCSHNVTTKQMYELMGCTHARSCARKHIQLNSKKKKTIPGTKEREKTRKNERNSSGRTVGLVFFSPIHQPASLETLCSCVVCMGGVVLRGDSRLVLDRGSRAGRSRLFFSGKSTEEGTASKQGIASTPPLLQLRPWNGSTTKRLTTPTCPPFVTFHCYLKYLYLI